jgi:hypothetical protein
MTRVEWSELATETLKLVDEKHASKGANIDHLCNILLGYRETVIDPKSESPFSSGSANDGSWKVGNEMALRDMRRYRDSLRE